MVAANAARPALIAAFTAAMATERFSALRVETICASAGVGRTTFYLHFRNLGELRMTVLAPLIDDIAAGIVAERPRGAALAVLDHFWTQRRHAPLWRDAGFRAQFADALAGRLAEASHAGHVEVVFVAAGITETLQQWAGGRISASAPELLARLRALGAPLRVAEPTPAATARAS